VTQLRVFNLAGELGKKQTVEDEFEQYFAQMGISM
jgi:hypothetical protein